MDTLNLRVLYYGVIFGPGNVEEAELAANEILAEIEDGTYIEEKEILFKDFILDYLNLITKPSVKPSTYSRYSKVVEKRLIKKFGHVKLKTITPVMRNKYYKELLDEGLTQELYSIYSFHFKISSKSSY